MSLADIIQRVNTTVLERAELWRPEKFVQLFVDDEPYLRFGERGIPTHRSSLFEFEYTRMGFLRCVRAVSVWFDFKRGLLC